MKRLNHVVLLFLLVCLCFNFTRGLPAFVRADSGGAVITGYQTSSHSGMGIDCENVRLAWKIESSERGVLQSAYQVKIKSDAGSVWDSGWVTSNRQAGVLAQNLDPETVYTWTVAVKDQNGTQIGLSAESNFETAPAVLDANWIGRGYDVVRKIFTLAQPVANIERARAYVGSTSFAETRVNGQKAGDYVLTPKLSVPDERVFYNTYDILPYLNNGQNALGLMLGQVTPLGGLAVGMFKIYYKDSSVQTISTGEDWKGKAGGPVTRADFFFGEDLNANLIAGWDTAAFVENGDWKETAISNVSSAMYVKDGVLRIPASSGTLFSRQSFSGNYSIEAKFKNIQNAFGLLFGSGSPNPALWQVYSNAFRAHKPGNWSAVDQDALSLTPGAPVTMKVDISGTTVTTYINGSSAPVHSTTFSSGQTAGRVGIRSVENEVSELEYIKVTQGGGVIWEDDFSGGVLDAVKWDVTADPVLEPAVSATKIIQEISPVKFTQFGSGSTRSFVADFGKNMSGYARVSVQGAASATVTVRYAELLNPDGTIYPNTTMFDPWCTYTLTGGADVFEPKFFYTGFRYAKIEYAGSAAFAASNVTACFISDEAEETGFFESSNSRLNAVFDLYRQAQLSNLVSNYTDCPQREKDGWTGDASVIKESSAILLADYCLAESYMKTLYDNIYPNGQPFVRVPKPASSPQGHGEFGYIDPPWTSAYFVFPYETYLQTGDPYYIRTAYDAMAKVFAFYQSRANNYIVSDNTFGDWIGYDQRDNKINASWLSSSYVYYAGVLLSEMSGVIGKDHTALDQYLSNMRSRLEQQYFNTTYYSTNTQTAGAMAIDLRVATPAQKKALITGILAQIKAADTTLRTGVLGTKSLYDALSDANEHKTLLDLTVSNKKCSFGYMLDNGATTLWEYW
ncbi:MAG: family 78 glycoside hydrolase catalytic domain, partial [Firmicutes bacterium]|nr:family 78 glycoside hydrolase catalytic domain [Bacillota bacterium]